MTTQMSKHHDAWGCAHTRNQPKHTTSDANNRATHGCTDIKVSKKKQNQIPPINTVCYYMLFLIYCFLFDAFLPKMFFYPKMHSAAVRYTPLGVTSDEIFVTCWSMLDRWLAHAIDQTCSDNSWQQSDNPKFNTLLIVLSHPKPETFFACTRCLQRPIDLTDTAHDDHTELSARSPFNNVDL